MSDRPRLLLIAGSAGVALNGGLPGLLTLILVYIGVIWLVGLVAHGLSRRTST